MACQLPSGYVVQFFLQKKGLLSTHQSAIREAPTVLSRLPSLMAADKPCPLLQPSLVINLKSFKLVKNVTMSKITDYGHPERK